MYNYRRVIPMVNLKGRDFLKLLDFTSEEIEYLVALRSVLTISAWAQPILPKVRK